MKSQNIHAAGQGLAAAPSPTHIEDPPRLVDLELEPRIRPAPPLLLLFTLHLRRMWIHQRIHRRRRPSHTLGIREPQIDREEINSLRALIAQPNPRSAPALLEQEAILFSYPLRHSRVLCCAAIPRFLLFAQRTLDLAVRALLVQLGKLLLRLEAALRVLPRDVGGGEAELLLLLLLFVPLEALAEVGVVERVVVGRVERDFGHAAAGGAFGFATGGFLRAGALFLSSAPVGWGARARAGVSW